MPNDKSKTLLATVLIVITFVGWGGVFWFNRARIQENLLDNKPRSTFQNVESELYMSDDIQYYPTSPELEPPSEATTLKDNAPSQTQLGDGEPTSAESIPKN